MTTKKTPEEGESSPPAPKRRTRKKSAPPKYQRKKLVPRGRKPKGSSGPKPQTKYKEVPGYAEWISRRLTELRAVSPPVSRFGVPDGMRKAQADKVWARARLLAKRDIANMKATGVLDTADARAEEALESTLTIMRSPMNQQMQLAAARQVLEWTKAKPATKTALTVNTAEAWLAEIAKDADASED